MDWLEKFPGVKWIGPKNWDTKASTGTWTYITDYDRLIFPSVMLSLMVGLIIIGITFPQHAMILLVYGLITFMAIQVYVANSSKKGSFLEFIGLGDRKRIGTYIYQGLLLAALFTFISFGLAGITKQSFVPAVPQSVVSTVFPQSVAAIAQQAYVNKELLQAIAYILLGAVVIAIIETVFMVIILAQAVNTRGVYNGIYLTALIRMALHYGALYVLPQQLGISPMPLMLSGVFLIINAPYVLSQKQLVTKLTCHSGVNFVAYSMPVFALTEKFAYLTDPVVAGVGIIITIILLGRSAPK